MSSSSINTRSNDSSTREKSCGQGSSRNNIKKNINGGKHYYQDNIVQQDNTLTRFLSLEKEVNHFNNLGIQLFRQGRFGSALFHFNEGFQLTTTVGGDFLDECTACMHGTSEEACGVAGSDVDYRSSCAASITAEQKCDEWDQRYHACTQIKGYEGTMFESKPDPPNDFMDPLCIINPDCLEQLQDMTNLTPSESSLLMGDIKAWILLSAMTLMLNAALGHYNMGKWRNAEQLLVMASELAQEGLKDAASDDDKVEERAGAILNREDPSIASRHGILPNVEKTQAVADEKEGESFSSMVFPFLRGTRHTLKRSYHIKMVHMTILFVLGQVRADEDQTLSQTISSQALHVQLQHVEGADVKSKSTDASGARSSDDNADYVEERKPKRRKTERTSLKECLKSLRTCATLAEELLGSDHLHCARIYALIGRILVSHNHSLGASYAFQAAATIYNKPLIRPGVEQNSLGRNIHVCLKKCRRGSSSNGTVFERSFNEGREEEHDLKHAAIMLEIGWSFGASAA